MKDHKLMYGIYLRAGILASLVTFALLFRVVPYAPPAPYELKRDIVTMVENIASRIDRIEPPPPADRPRVAVAADNMVGDDEIVETINSNEFVENTIRTAPTGPEIEIVEYFRVEIKPQPVFTVRPEYPAILVQAGVEGRTVVKALVDTDGSVMEVVVLRSSGNQMLDEAALAAARQWKFSPARQRDRYVRVYVAIPMDFRLTSG